MTTSFFFVPASLIDPRVSRFNCRDARDSMLYKINNAFITHVADVDVTAVT